MQLVIFGYSALDLIPFQLVDVCSERPCLTTSRYSAFQGSTYSIIPTGKSDTTNDFDVCECGLIGLLWKHEYLKHHATVQSVRERYNSRREKIL